MRGIFHCFTGNLEQAHQVIGLGFYLGIGGVVTYKNSGLGEVVAQIDLNRIVLETDSPYLAPIPYRGKPNLPQYVREVAEFLAMLRGESYEDFAAMTTANFARLFPLAHLKG